MLMHGKWRDEQQLCVGQAPQIARCSLCVLHRVRLMLVLPPVMAFDGQRIW